MNLFYRKYLLIKQMKLSIFQHFHKEIFTILLVYMKYEIKRKKILKFKSYLVHTRNNFLKNKFLYQLFKKCYKLFVFTN